jgi:superfamily II DNA or RNA helicase
VLFVAHRKELLTQSRSTFRQVLRRGDFGELLVDGERPREWRYVFASVQSLAQLDLDQLDPAQFDLVVVDEFHHAMAATYRKLLKHLQPKVLVGLTATPERTDSADVREWFDGRTAVELRLWEALEQGLLAPFQYFGLHDDVALNALTWRRGRGYDPTELSNVYTGDDHRVRDPPGRAGQGRRPRSHACPRLLREHPAR